MNKTPYVFRSNENTIIPVSKDTEPAFNDLFGARYFRRNRENEFNRSNLYREENVQDYIDSIKEEIYLRARAIRFQLYEIGRLLCDVKSLLPHGQFMPWVESNVEFSKSTALNCMRVYKSCMGHPELVEHFKPSALYVICSPKFPGQLRETLFKDSSGVYDVSEKELLEMSFKWKNGEVTLKSPEVQNLLNKQKNVSFYSLYKIELDALIQVLDDRLRSVKRLDEKHISYPLLPKEDNARDESFFEVAGMIEGFIGKVEAMLMSLEQIPNRKPPKAEVIPIDVSAKIREYMNRNRRKRKI